MPSGLFAKKAVQAGITRLAYDAPADKITTLNILVSNDGNTSVTIKIGIGYGSAIGKDDVIQPKRTLIAGQVIERTGIVVSPGEGVIIDADADGLVIRLHGFEEDR